MTFYVYFFSFYSALFAVLYGEYAQSLQMYYIPRDSQQEKNVNDSTS